MCEQLTNCLRVTSLSIYAHDAEMSISSNMEMSLQDIRRSFCQISRVANYRGSDMFVDPIRCRKLHYYAMESDRRMGNTRISHGSIKVNEWSG